MRDKLGQELPETVEEVKERLADLKIAYFSLVRQGAAVPEVNAVRRKAASLESWRKHLEQQKSEGL